MIPANWCNDKGGIFPPSYTPRIQITSTAQLCATKSPAVSGKQGHLFAYFSKILYAGNRAFACYFFSKRDFIVSSVRPKLRCSSLRCPQCQELKRRGRDSFLSARPHCPLPIFSKEKKNKTSSKFHTSCPKHLHSKKKICSDPAWPQPLGERISKQWLESRV